MKHLPVAISLLCATINVAATIWVYQRVKSSALADNRPEVKVVNAREPMLATLTVLRTQQYGGKQVATSFAASVRDTTYLVESEGHRYLLYSPLLPRLAKDTIVQGWFVHLYVQDSAIEGQPTFIVPIEYVVGAPPAIEKPITVSSIP